MSDPTTNKYAPTVWGTTTTRDLECPSGQLCQVRMPGVQTLIAAGILESADTLTTLVDEKHIKRVSPKKAPNTNGIEVDGASLLKDPDSIRKVFTLVDQITVHMVLQPQIYPVPGPGEDRVGDRVYVDMVDMLDRMFIFQYAIGGDQNLEQFRDQFAEGLGGVAAR